MTRLSAARLDELYLGTLRLVAEHGYEKITMDQVAEATHSSKATLYRQWGSKTGLVVEALRSLTVTEDAMPDTGSLRDDLLAMFDCRARVLEGEGALIGAILHAVKQDADLRSAVRDQILSVAEGRFTTVVERAVTRGEVDADSPALRFVQLVLIAPFVLRLVIDDVPADQTYLTQYLDAVLLPALGVS